MKKKVKWLKSRNAVSKKSSPRKKNYRELKMNMELKLLRQKVCNHLIPTLGTPLMVGLHTLNQHYLNYIIYTIYLPQFFLVTIKTFSFCDKANDK